MAIFRRELRRSVNDTLGSVGKIHDLNIEAIMSRGQ